MTSASQMEARSETKTARLSGVNENTGVLKWIALVCMIVDHAGVIFFPRLGWMRVVGRIAFPLYCWCLVVGAEYTHDIYRYGLRLLILFAVSQPIFMGALSHSWQQPNIFLTLFMGLAAIMGIRERKPWLTVLMVAASYFVKADYGMRGVLCILTLYMLRKNPIGLAMGFGLFCVAWGQGASWTLRLPWGRATLSWGYASSIVWRWGRWSVRLQSCALLALPFLLWPMKGLWKWPAQGGAKWLSRLFYWGYPLHLAALWGLRLLIG